jgi:hypothetical protein
MLTRQAPELPQLIMNRSWSKRLRNRSGHGSGYPVGTIAFYGPTNRHASKVAVGIVGPDDHCTHLERWFEDQLDVRIDRRIGEAVLAFLKHHGVRRVVVADGIIGCPHEEDVDYPAGTECPTCTFWQGKDRFEHAKPDDDDSAFPGSGSSSA